MITHILVPLDGTLLAEAALAATKTLARLFGAKVTLLHVIEPAPTPTVHGERHLTDATDAEHYLRQLQQRFTAEGLPCNYHIHSDVVDHLAEGIVAHEAEITPDLIIMCTHGPGKLERLLRGSMAQQVVSLGQTPLLLIRPESQAAAEPFMLQRILVPLDGDPGHEKGLDLACDMAAAGKAQLQLLSILPEISSLPGRRATLSRYLPGTTWAMQRATLQNLTGYLEKLLTGIERHGIVATAEIQYGKVAKTISERTDAIDADLIVLATHGKAGTQAFWANSVAAEVQSRTSRALLLIPL